MQGELFHEILMARQRVYEAGSPTPLQHLSYEGVELYLKREDLSPIHAYKWRGAYNRMAVLSQEERRRGVVCASAGNHAQGVALAARKMGVHAKIFMPLSTPRMKRSAVRRHGGEQVEVILVGDRYDDAALEAKRVCEEEGRSFIHPYDDLITMGGQGTLADEIVMSGMGPFDVAYLQIGGGGMAAAAACWLKTYFPNIYIIGVEGEDQASMAAAIANGGPITLEHIDVFADGTAAKRVGDLTFPLCRDLIDEFITVTNDELSAAIQAMWELLRCVPEPSGVMGLAGLLNQRERMQGKRALCVVSGANMDFSLLTSIARHAGIGAHRRRYYRFEIGEKRGSLLHLLDNVLEEVNIIEFQYGKTQNEVAHPVIGFEASQMELDLLHRNLTDYSIPHEDVTSAEDVDFRIINYEPDTFRQPYFIKYDFPERAGALRDFLVVSSQMANICYFNYVSTGEPVGRALMGFEFESADHREAFQQMLRDCRLDYKEISEKVLERIL